MSRLATEIAEIPEAAARLLDGGAATVANLAAILRAEPFPVVATVARGSSDHAAAMLAYAIGTGSGRIVASYPPSLASIHDRTPMAKGALALAISQSGQSPDIRAAAATLARGGARLVVLTNAPDAPLAAEGDHVIDIRAGPESAVAATKSFINSVLAGAMLLAEWHGDDDLRGALTALPEALAEALAMGAPTLDKVLAREDRLMVLGRGPSLGAAGEIALKAMELCGMTGLAYSSAEVRHGPMQILRDGFPVLDLTGTARFDDTTALAIPPPRALHPLLDPLLQIARAYVSLEAAARARGLDPDSPDRLEKETKTV